MSEWRLPAGATPTQDGTFFRIWAPHSKRVRVVINEKDFELSSCGDGYWEGEGSGIFPGDRYSVRLEEGPLRPDPVSRSLPDGVHGVSEVVDPDQFCWNDHSWNGLPLSDFVLYELHIGTFTPAGTLDSAIEALPYLCELGVTCIELMPVAQFPGTRNWGYDGVSLFAVQNSYGGPEALKRFVDASHRCGLAVCLDVVYNHFGPEGNYLSEFGPFFTDAYRTPWGPAVNFDGQGSDGVRDYITNNVLYWFYEYHIDALRLDAIHSIFDFGARHILSRLKDAAGRASAELGRPCLLIAESDQNDPRILNRQERGGYDLDAQWSDDFHHAVHVLLTGEKSGYYKDYKGFSDLVTALKQGFVYAGEYSGFRGCSFGSLPEDGGIDRMVFAVQNHDQIGNRASGDRLTGAVGLSALRAAAAVHLLSPGIPLLFMGEEYGETAPFCYFVDHGDTKLLEAVRKGRASEFPEFQNGEVPDPGSPETLQRSCPDRALCETGEHAVQFDWYRRLLALRKQIQPGYYFRSGGYAVSSIPGAQIIKFDYGQRYTLLVSLDEAAHFVNILDTPVQEVLLESGCRLDDGELMMGSYAVFLFSR